jgi:hypothetical protein
VEGSRLFCDCRRDASRLESGFLTNLRWAMARAMGWRTIC